MNATIFILLIGLMCGAACTLSILTIARSVRWKLPIPEMFLDDFCKHEWKQKKPEWETEWNKFITKRWTGERKAFQRIVCKKCGAIRHRRIKAYWIDQWHVKADWYEADGQQNYSQTILM
jgi:hypothetical protein